MGQVEGGLVPGEQILHPPLVDPRREGEAPQRRPSPRLFDPSPGVGRRHGSLPQAQGLDQALAQPELIVAVVNREAWRATEPPRVLAEESGAEGVEGPREHALGPRSAQRRDAFLHFAGRPVGEGQGGDGVRAHAPLGDQVGDATGQRSGLA